MKYVTAAGAWCNGEVAYIAWDIAAQIDGCIGFMVTRIHESGDDEGQHRILPTWVCFEDQSNPNWIAQDASVWPIQSMQWRDLTLRKSRNSTAVRPIGFRVHYEIVPVGLAGPHDTPLPASPTAPAAGPKGVPSYDGPRHPLTQIGEPTETNSITVTHDYGGDSDATKVSATFTNGILSTQSLLYQLEAIRKAPPKKLLMAAQSPDPATRARANMAKDDHLLAVLKKEIVKPASPIRKFLNGDVLEFVTRLLKRAEEEGGEVYLALYELTDPELVKLLVTNVKAKRAHVILSTAGSKDPNPAHTPKDQRKPVIWDTENTAARALLHAAAGDPSRVIDRMFNNSSHIGHNKFAVYVKDGVATAVMTGSTNWTPTGLCTQSNNSIIVEDEDLAGDYLEFWNKLKDDPQPNRVPYPDLVGANGKSTTVDGALPSNGKQGKALRTADAATHPSRDLQGAGSVTLWRSPNTDKVAVPKDVSEPPPDLAEVYDLMDHASAIFFLTFLPGEWAKNCIVEKAMELVDKPDGPLVLGACSSPKALPKPSDGSDPGGTYKDEHGKTRPLPMPAIWWPKGDQSRIAMIRAAAIDVPIGNFQPELLSAGNAIIHDKIVVIDPLNAEKCAVVTGSHNLGYKASYANDENMIIVRGNRPLAIAYAVHVLDLYDHYVFRARLEQDLRDQLKAGTIRSPEDAAAQADPHGLLPLDGGEFQNRYLQQDRELSAMGYFLDHL
jgi:hypothetical protein